MAERGDGPRFPAGGDLGLEVRRAVARLAERKRLPLEIREPEALSRERMAELKRAQGVRHGNDRDGDGGS